MATVIDSLIVTLGLDPKDFTKGQKEAAKSLVETKNKTKEASNEMGKAITGAARQFAIAFLGFESAAGLVRTLSGLNRMTRELGFIAQNTDNSASELRNWSNAVEVATGDGSALVKTVQQIAAEQSNFQLQGTTKWAGYLNQLGLGADALSESRSELQVLMDLATAFQEAMKLQGGRQRVNVLAQGMGLDQNMINFLLQGPEKIRGLLTQQRKGMFQVTQGMTASADRLASRFTLMKQHGESWLLALLEKLEPILNRWADALEKWMASVDLQKLSERIDAMVTSIADLVDALGTLVNFIAPIVKWIGEKIGQGAGAAAGMWDKLFPDDATKKQNAAVNRQLKTTPYLQQLDAIGASGTYNIGHGKNRTIGEIVDSLGLDEATALKVMAGLSGQTGKSQAQELSEKDYKAIRDYVRAKALQLEAQSPRGAMVTNPSALDAAKGAGAVAGVSNDPRVAGNTYNSTQIDSITIHVPGGDATAIANNIEREVRRKNLVANAETGLA